MLHNLKIKQCYLMHILEGIKKFEVRLNDRDYQMGDTIHFLPLEDDNYNVYKKYNIIPDYKIIYTRNSVALKESYIILGIEPIDKEIKNES